MIRFDPSGSVEKLDDLIREVSSEEKATGLLVLACDDNGFTPENLDGLLKGVNKPLVGGVFPALIYGRRLIRKGSIVAGLSGIHSTMHIPGLSNPESDYEARLDDYSPNAESVRTMMVFVDGFAKRIHAFIESLFNVFGLEINYIGGGAGSLTMEQKPCLFTNEGMAADGAVLALMETESGVGVSHGWRTLSGPLRVTGSDRNIIQTLDWRPAFEVYREIVSPHAGKTVTAEDFFAVSKAYPFGISRMGSEQIVRDPIRAGSDQTLVCVGEVPEGSFVSILHGDAASLIDAARNALLLAKKALPDRKPEGTRLFMDCISRVLFLEDRFEEELEAVFEDGHPLIGACTIGEIANSGAEYLEFYNKTAVVAVLEAL